MALTDTINCDRLKGDVSTYFPCGEDGGGLTENTVFAAAVLARRTREKRAVACFIVRSFG